MTTFREVGEFLKSLVSGATKDGRVLSGQHEAALSAAMDHLRKADELMSGVLAAHGANMTARGPAPEPDADDTTPPAKRVTKSNNRWILGGR